MSQPSVHQLYRRLETVGKGAYGSVHKGIHIPTGNVVALKIINLDTSDDDVGDIQREVALLSQLRDAPNVTKYYGCYLDGPRVWIVMEFAQGGSVLSLMKATNDGCLEEKYVAVIIREVLVGLSYLHKSSIIHRDLKAANILVTAAGKVMICDFGVSALLATSSSKRNTLTGTPYWMAPEVVQSVPAYDTRADIWSLGIMVYEMIKGAPPHSTLDQLKVMGMISKSKPPRFAESDGGKDMRDFLVCCLRESPNDRMPAEELLKSKWIKGVGKVQVLFLKELIQRYEAWSRSNGPRMSLAGPLDWEGDEHSTYASFEVPWEFETVRGRPFNHKSDDVDLDYEDGSRKFQNTLRAPPSSNLPSSLKLLFESDDPNKAETSLSESSPNPHSLSPQTVPNLMRLDPHPQSGHDSSLGVGGSAQSTATSRSRDGSDTEAEVAPLGDAIAFPSVGKERLPPLGPGIPRRPLANFSNGSNFSFTDSSETSLSTRPTKSDCTSPSQSTSLLTLSSTSPPSPNGSRSNLSISKSLTNRRRSQSTTDSSQSSLVRQSRFYTTNDLISKMDQETLQEFPSFQRLVTSSGSHQSAFSLDDSQQRSPSRISISPQLGTILPIVRTQPAVALADSSTINQPQNEVSLLTPSRPFAFSPRGRSNSAASDSKQALGLKEKLKIPSMSTEHQLVNPDLLPPSPSISSYNPRFFFPSTSPLHQMGSDRPIDEVDESLVLGPNNDSTNNLWAKGNNDPLNISVTTSQLTAAPQPLTTVLSSPSTTAPLGPVIRPLDFTSVMFSPEGTHQELAQTVESLGQWLSAIEVGIGTFLDSFSELTIESDCADGSNLGADID